MNEELRHRIEKRAYAIWEYRQRIGLVFTSNAFGVLREITAEDDWFEAEEDIQHAEALHKEYGLNNE